MRKKAALALLIFLILGIITTSLYLLVVKKDDYAAEIGGKPISIDEYMVYLFEQKLTFERDGGSDIWEFEFDGVSSEILAKQKALDSVTYVKVAVAQASKLGLVITDNDKEIAGQDAEQFLKIFNEKTKGEIVLTEAVVTDVMQDILLFVKVYEAVTESFELTESDFLVFYDEYLKNNINEFVDIELQCVYIDGLDEQSTIKVGEARSKIFEGVPFEKVVSEYSDLYDSARGVITYTDIPAEWGVTDQAYSLSQGDISDIIKTDKGYFILYAKSVYMLNQEEQKDYLKQRYTAIKKDEIYNQEYKKWSKDIVVKKNENVWNDVKISQF